MAKALDLPSEVEDRLEEVVAEYENSSDLGDRETLIADSRYQYIEKVVSASVVKGQREGELTFSEKIDKVVTHRVFAIPLFLCTMLLMFAVTFVLKSYAVVSSSSAYQPSKTYPVLVGT